MMITLLGLTKHTSVKLVYIILAYTIKMSDDEDDAELVRIADAALKLQLF